MDNNLIFFPLNGKTTIRARALFIAQRIDVRSLESGSCLSTSPLTISVRENGCAVIFRYGSIVLFDVDPLEEAALLDHLYKLLSQPFDKTEKEDVLIKITPEREEGMSAGIIHLTDLTLERIQLIAEILSRSVVLDYYEAKVARDFDSIEQLALSLKKGIFRRPRLKIVLDHIGNSLLGLHKMVGRVEVTEKPALLWGHPELERGYARLEDEYEIEERHLALERKLDLISRTAETSLDLLQTQRTIRVEWYIVILIVVEIFLTLYDLFFTK